MSNQYNRIISIEETLPSLLSNMEFGTPNAKVAESQGSKVELGVGFYSCKNEILVSITSIKVVRISEVCSFSNCAAKMW